MEQVIAKYKLTSLQLQKKILKASEYGLKSSSLKEKEHPKRRMYGIECK